MECLPHIINSLQIYIIKLNFLSHSSSDNKTSGIKKVEDVACAFFVHQGTASNCLGEEKNDKIT